jgi:hypothetical protein
MKIIGQIHCQNENLSKITSILPKAQPITILSIPFYPECAALLKTIAYFLNLAIAGERLPLSRADSSLVREGAVVSLLSVTSA